MATSVKLTDNLYWDPHGIAVKKYTAPGSSSSDATFTGIDRLSSEFWWIDCGGFASTTSYTSPPCWEVPRNSTVNIDVPYNITFTSTPRVPIVVFGQWAGGNGSKYDRNTAASKTGFYSATDRSTTGVTYNVTNGNTSIDWDHGFTWIVVGRM